MRIFITGAAGFIGRKILKLLSLESNELLLLAKDKPDYRLLAKYKQKTITGNLRNIINFKKDIQDFNPQACIHLAWEGIPDFSFNMCKKNLDNSLALLDFIVNETECQKIIVSGTCFEYGKTKGKCKESDNISVNSFFSWAKLSLYNYSHLICKKSKKDLIWFRIFYAYGPGQREESLIPTLIHSFKNRVKPNINNPLNAHDFIHIEDIAEAFRIVVNKKIKSGIYNLGSGKSTKVIDICKIVEKIIWGTTRLSDKITLNRNSQGTINFWADTAKTQKALRWKSNISLKSGIEDYLKQEMGL